MEPGAPPPLTVETRLTLDDWTAALMESTGALYRRQRRRLLTVFLPVTLALLTAAAVIGRESAEGRGWSGWLAELRAVSFSSGGGLILLAALAFVAIHAFYPRLVCRKLRDRLRIAGFSTPVPIAIAFGPAGILSTEALRSGFLPWTRVTAVNEGADHIIAVVNATEEPVVVPKRDLQPQQLAALRQWVRMPGSPAGPRTVIPAAPATGSGTIAFSFVHDADSRAAAILRELENPAVRRQRLFWFLRFWLMLTLLGPALFALIWALDPWRLPLSIAGPLMLEMAPQLLGYPAAVASALILVFMLAGPPLRRLIARQTAVGMAAQSSTDPVAVDIDQNGLVAQQGGSWSRFSWQAFTTVHRTPRHLVLPLRRGSTVVLPLAALTAAQAEDIAVLARRRLPAVRG